MKRYKLLKDLPTFKAGDLFYISQYGDLIHDGGDVGITAYARQTLKKFPNILTEWFEEIQEPTDSIHWKPKDGKKYWFLDENGDTNFAYFDVDDPSDRKLLEFGNAYRTSGECEKARGRKLAEVRLRRTSTFEPDFKNGKPVYTVGYDCSHKRLYVTKLLGVIIGNPITYESLEDAKKSIKENERDWRIYFGIETLDD
jgi:hypothetical protein